MPKMSNALAVRLLAAGILTCTSAIKISTDSLQLLTAEPTQCDMPAGAQFKYRQLPLPPLSAGQERPTSCFARLLAQGPSEAEKVAAAVALTGRAWTEGKPGMSSMLMTRNSSEAQRRTLVLTAHHGGSSCTTPGAAAVQIVAEAQLHHYVAYFSACYRSWSPGSAAPARMQALGL